MALTRYLLNLATGVLHDTQHMSERCNTDQIERSDRKRASSEANLMSEPRYKRLCRWCHPKVVANPEPPEGSDDDDTA